MPEKEKYKQNHLQQQVFLTIFKVYCQHIKEKKKIITDNMYKVFDLTMPINKMLLNRKRYLKRKKKNNTG